MNISRYLPRFRQAYREMQTLALREKWTRTEIEAFQLERLNQLWSRAVEHVPYYSRLRSDRNLPPRFESMDEFKNTVPVLEKALKQADMETRSFERAEHLLDAIGEGDPDVLITDGKIKQKRVF